MSGATFVPLAELAATGQLDPRHPQIQEMVEGQLRWELDGWAKTYRTPVHNLSNARHARVVTLNAYLLAVSRLLAEEGGLSEVIAHLRAVADRLEERRR